MQVARPIVLGQNAQIIRYGEASENEPATIAGWGAIKVRLVLHDVPKM